VDDITRRTELPHNHAEVPAGAQMWMHLSNRIYDYLDSITLEEAVESSRDNAQESLFGSGFQKSAA
jgi:DNA-binding IscR family transcriptional regulator